LLAVGTPPSKVNVPLERYRTVLIRSPGFGSPSG
jgi:hypothetical protein